MSTLHDVDSRGFASDNYAGAHPEIIAALAEANGGHQISYGEDVYTARLHDVMAAHLGPDVQVFPVFNGTGANVLSLQSMLPRWGAVICTETAHIHSDENGAPERVGGLKLLTVPTPNGKLTPELIDRQAYGWGDEHRAQPLAVSITQTTELGTAYTPDEIRAIADHIHPLGMHLHLDGARIANAAASLDLPLRAFTTDAGVDLVSFGGTKNGLLFGEAIVVLRPEASDGLDVSAEDEHAARLEDAIRLGATDRPARGRPVARICPARQRDGRQARRRRCGPTRHQDHPAGAGERRLRDHRPGRGGPAPADVPVLRLEPGHR